MTRHWIITNREVSRDTRRGRERVVEDNHSPLPVFRVGEFDADALEALGGAGRKPSDDALRDAVTFVPDAYIDSYADVRTAPAAALAGTQRLFKSLYQEVSDPAGGDVLFFIHGFNYSWTDALRHLVSLDRIYARPEQCPISHIVYYSWPSYGSQGRYPSDQKIARLSGQVLGRVFGKMVQFYRDFFVGRRGQRPEFCGQQVHVAAHSMGNQVLEEMMRSIVEFEDLRVPAFDQVLMLNADADWSCLNAGPAREKPLHRLPEYCERVTVYNNHSDDALAISETTKNREKRLGRHGPPSMRQPPLADRTIVVDCSGLDETRGRDAGAGVDASIREASAAVGQTPGADFVGVAKRVLGTDTGGARERMFDHWGYLHRPEVVADVWQVLSRVSSSQIVGREPKGGVSNLYRLLDR